MGSPLRYRRVAWLALGVGAILIALTALPATRYRALALLRQQPLYDGRPLDYWLEAFDGGAAPLRHQAALVLGNPELIEACKDDDVELGRVVDRLAQGLGDSDPIVRKCAATSLLAYPRTLVVKADLPHQAHYWVRCGTTMSWFAGRRRARCGKWDAVRVVTMAWPA